MGTVANPHDAFCKFVLGKPELAAAFLAHFLPAEAVLPLDLTSLTAVPGSFVDPELTNHHSDLLFTATSASGADSQTLVYFLFEHKSKPDRKTPLQLLRYMARIWDEYCQQGGRLPLPSILPVLIHQGPPAWPWPPSFSAILEERAAYAPYALAFKFHLVDLCDVDDAALPEHSFLRGALLVMKYVQRKDLAEVIARHRQRLNAIVQLPDGVALLQTMIRYILYVIPAQRRDPVLDALGAETGDKGDNVMRAIANSVMDEVFHKGMSLGRSEGLDLGRHEGVQRALAEVIVEDLELRFGVIPRSLAERVQGLCDLEALKELRRKLRDAASLDECMRMACSDTAQ